MNHNLERALFAWAAQTAVPRVDVIKRATEEGWSDSRVFTLIENALWGTPGGHPGDVLCHHEPDSGRVCEVCGVPSVMTVQGETDSFGRELVDLCEECNQKEKDDYYESEDVDDGTGPDD